MGPGVAATARAASLPGQNLKSMTYGKAKISASVSNANPKQFTEVTVYGRLTVNGVGKKGGTMKVAWHYKSTTPTKTARTGANGQASVERDIAGATVRYRVNVVVAIGHYTVTTWFVPRS